jgi:hypothetical protein
MAQALSEQKNVLASSWRKTTSLRFNKLRLGTQFMGPGGPPFAKASARQAIHGGKRQVMEGKDRFMSTMQSIELIQRNNGTQICTGFHRYFLKL